MRLGQIVTYGATGLGMAGVSLGATGAVETGTLCVGLGVIGVAGRAYLGRMLGGGARAA
jgi:hypothetical protein